MLVIGNHVIELRRRLVVPGTPGTAAIHGNGCTLIDAHKNDVWVLRIDPDGVIVVAARRAFPRSEILPAVGGFVRRRIGDVDGVLVTRGDTHPGEIRAASPHPLLVVDALPMLAGVVRAVDSAFRRRVHHRVHAVRVTRRYADTNASELIVFPIRETSRK